VSAGPVKLGYDPPMPIGGAPRQEQPPTASTPSPMLALDAAPRCLPDSLRLRHFHALGPRPTYEAIRELAVDHPDAIGVLEEYAALSADLVRAVGADAMSPPAVALVPKPAKDKEP
jgi:hypothetical protein